MGHSLLLKTREATLDDYNATFPTEGSVFPHHPSASLSRYSFSPLYPDYLKIRISVVKSQNTTEKSL